MTPTPGMSPVLTGDMVLRGLRWALHISVAVLLIVGVSRAVAPQPGAAHMTAVLLTAGLFAGVYVLGIRVRQTRLALWLATVTALWVVLLLLELSFTWLAFPLFFLHMHLLRPRHAVLSVVVLTAAVVTAQWSSLGRPDMPSLLGPLLGAVFAVVMALAYQGLYAENRAQQAALEELRLTREQLSVSQRRAGALAERERLARDIHDTLAQGFSSVVLLARSAAANLGSATYEATAAQVETIRSTAAENLDEARRLVRVLQSGEEDSQPLTQSLHRVCQAVETEAAARGEVLSCRLAVKGEPLPLPVSHSIALLRAAQASLANVSRHAQAEIAVVTVTYTETTVLLDIVDNGIGFDSGVVSASAPRLDGTGFGLLSVQERAEALGGVFRIESALGQGTAVSVRLPLREDTND